jgi:PTH1 family peptidyl-tRNA hydrolase
MQLVLGLGNPGPRYARTRHNVGFLCVEELARRLGLCFQDAAPEYRAAVGAGPGGPLTLLEPLTYMNRSGLALLAWSRDTGVPVTPSAQAAGPGDPPVVPVVVCDDLHLPLGSVRIRPSGSDGGQNGLASVLEAAQTLALPRLRLGVGPLAADLDPAAWADYVLEPFPEADRPQVGDLVTRGADALEDLLALGPEAAAARHNRRIRPAPDLPAGDR